MSPTVQSSSTTTSMKDIVVKSRDVLVMLPQNPSDDMVAAALAIYESINTKERNVYVACPTKVDPAKVLVPGTEQITDKIGNRNLVISLQVASRDSIDKVSYNLDEYAKVFNLVIQPKKGHPPLKTNDITYSYAGVQADLVILVGVRRLEELGVFYQEEAKVFSEATTVALSSQPIHKYAMHEFVDTKVASVAEVAYKWIKELGLPTNEAAATAIIYGIEANTNQLMTATVTPELLETVAALLRQGGKRMFRGNGETNGLMGQPNGQLAGASGMNQGFNKTYQRMQPLTPTM